MPRPPVPEFTPKNPELPRLQKEVAKAPEKPGVYKWKDKEGVILYVGKAKVLRHRLKSYVSAQGGHMGPWKRSFIEKIHDFEVTVVSSELEALVLETNLIKEFRPKFNVLMKDDKNYIYARVTVDEAYPRIEMVRKVDPKDKAKYFGPMLSGGELIEALTALRTLFPFRTCKMEISVKEQNSESREQSSVPLEVVCTHKDRATPCLDHHIGKCSAPCIGLITPEQYKSEIIDGVMRFLKGDYEFVRSSLKVKMQQAASEKRFEVAAKLRDYLGLLDRLEKREQQVVSDTSKEDSDAIAIAVKSGRAHVCLLRRRNGRIIGDDCHALSGYAEDLGETLSQFIALYYQDALEIPPEIYVNIELSDKESLEQFLSERRGHKVSIIIPERGKKAAIVQLAEKNALEKAKLSELKWEAEARNREDALRELSEIILPHFKKAEHGGASAKQTALHRIECYDISHLGGTETVASMTVAIDGALQSKYYRSFNVRTLKAGDVDDYQSLKEAITRRLRYLNDDLPREETRLEKEGIVLRKMKKSDRAPLVKFLELTDEKELDAMELMLVAVKEENIVASAALHQLQPLSSEVRFLKVDSAERGHKLGQVILRKLLRSVKRGKIYIVCTPELETYYSEVGFRYVIKAPAVLDASVERQKASGISDPLVMLYEVAQHKTDASFSQTPDLLVIDGGKGQLSSVVEVLNHFELAIPVIGLAKREEEIFVPNHSDPLIVPKDSQGKFLLMRLRDEAHRFANYKREGRGLKELKHSALDDVPGIGDETKKKLREKFGTISAIKEATDEELLSVLSQSQLEQVRKSFM